MFNFLALNMYQPNVSCYFLYMGLKYYTKHWQITITEKWTWLLSHCLCHIKTLSPLQEPVFFLHCTFSPATTWNAVKHWSIREFVLIWERLILSCMHYLSLFLTTFSSGNENATLLLGVCNWLEITPRSSALPNCFMANYCLPPSLWYIYTRGHAHMHV